MEKIIYIADGFWREIGDERVQSRYLIMSGGPVPMLLLAALYLYFVRVSGPRWMNKREAFDLKWIIRFYNIAMSAVNFYIFFRISVQSKFGLDYFGCEQSNPFEDDELIFLAMLYYLSKIVELLDTAFFILRKKYSQASNLHVFHHSFMIIISWTFVKIAPGGSTVVFPYLNVGVHTIMYGYYFLATFKQLQPYLWWKRHLTKVQLTQFLLSIIHFSFQTLAGCDYPPALTFIGFFFNFIFVILFLNFYYNAYVKKGRDLKLATEKDKRRTS